MTAPQPAKQVADPSEARIWAALDLETPIQQVTFDEASEPSQSNGQQISDADVQRISGRDSIHPGEVNKRKYTWLLVCFVILVVVSVTLGTVLRQQNSAPLVSPTTSPATNLTAAPVRSPTRSPATNLTTTAPVRPRTQSPTRNHTMAPARSPTRSPTRNVTVAEFIASRPDLSTLNSALKRAELNEFFDTRPGPFTYFAPDNDAWDAIQGYIVPLLFKNSELRPQFTVLLGHHGLGALFFQHQLVDGLVLNNTLVGESVTISSPPTAVNDLRISEFNNVASNGVFHITSGGILAPSWVFNSLAERVESAAPLSTFNSLLGLAYIDLSTWGRHSPVLEPPTKPLNGNQHSVSRS
jgi:uncharacterized surface protein with fasciclin (FAS1) repeats